MLWSLIGWTGFVLRLTLGKIFWPAMSLFSWIIKACAYIVARSGCCGVGCRWDQEIEEIKAWAELTIHVLTVDWRNVISPPPSIGCGSWGMGNGETRHNPPVGHGPYGNNQWGQCIRQHYIQLASFPRHWNLYENHPGPPATKMLAHSISLYIGPKGNTNNTGATYLNPTRDSVISLDDLNRLVANRWI